MSLYIQPLSILFIEKRDSRACEVCQRSTVFQEMSTVAYSFYHNILQDLWDMLYVVVWS